MVIFSGVKFLNQLVVLKTDVLFTKKGVSDIEKVNEKYLFNQGFTAQKIIEYKALAGDTADNIPGAKGIGAKTAEKLLTQFDSIEEIYSNLNNLDISTKLKEKLIESKEIVLISKKLATIDTSVPLQLNLNDFIFNKSITNEFVQRMTNLESITLIDRYKEILDASSLSIPASQATEINDINDLKNILKKVDWEISFYLTDDINFNVCCQITKNSPR